MNFRVENSFNLMCVCVCVCVCVRAPFSATLLLMIQMSVQTYFTHQPDPN